MDEAVKSFDMDMVKQLSQQAEEAGQRKEQIRSSVERTLTTRALQIGPCLPVDQVDRFLQFVIGLAKESLCGVSFTVQLLQDMFDVSTTKRCEQLFIIVERNIAVFKTDFFFNACKNLILRMCNDLLKRLSRTVNTAFCGRIIVLLAKSLPLNERSGLNLPGHYNTDNVTVFERDENKMDQMDPDQSTADEEEDRDEGELREKDLTVTVNYALYVKFWEIQSFFANPNLLHDADAFRKFESNLADVLTVFNIFKLERSGSSKAQNDDNQTPTLSNGFVERLSTTDGESASSETAINTIDADNTASQQNGLELEDNFFTKYLTSQKLFNLQLADSQFRRYFLVQCLIFMNCLSTKPRSKDCFAAVEDSFVNDVTEKCYTCLRETYPHGAHFAESVKRILTYEKSWIAWKSDGCTNVIESRLGYKCLAYKKRPVERFDPNVIDLSNLELTRLWNINPNNLAACTEEARKCVPQLRTFLEEGLDEMDPEQQVDEQYRSVNNENYQWMASRFLLANSDNYLNIAVPEAKAPCKPVAKVLEQAIYLTARNTAELAERASEVDRRMKEIEAAKEAEIIRQAEEEKERIMREAAEATARREAEQKIAAEKTKAAAAEKEREDIEKLAAEKVRKSEEKQRSEKRVAEERARKEESERMKKEELAMKARLEQKVENAQKRKAAAGKDSTKDSETADKPRTKDDIKSSRTSKKDDSKSLKEDSKSLKENSKSMKEDGKNSKEDSKSLKDDEKSATRRPSASRRGIEPPATLKNGHYRDATEPITPVQTGDRKEISSSTKKRKAERSEKGDTSSRHIKKESVGSPPQQKTLRRGSNTKR